MRKLRVTVGRRIAALLLPGGLVLGTSCAESIRESAVDGSLSFVEDTANAVLESLIPVGDFLGGGE
jgi:hypothetical protein